MLTRRRFANDAQIVEVGLMARGRAIALRRMSRGTALERRVLASLISGDTRTLRVTVMHVQARTLKNSYDVGDDQKVMRRSTPRKIALSVKPTTAMMTSQL